MFAVSRAEVEPNHELSDREYCRVAQRLRESRMTSAFANRSATETACFVVGSDNEWYGNLADCVVNVIWWRGALCAPAQSIPLAGIIQQQTALRHHARSVCGLGA